MHAEELGNTTERSIEGLNQSDLRQRTNCKEPRRVLWSIASRLRVRPANGSQQEHSQSWAGSGRRRGSTARRGIRLAPRSVKYRAARGGRQGQEVGAGGAPLEGTPPR